MLIRVYDKLGELISEEKWNAPLIDYIKKEAGEFYSDDIDPPLSIKINGDKILPSQYYKKFLDGDIVEITLEPESEVVYYIIVILLVAYSYYTASNIDTGYSSTERGESIYLSEVRANKAKPNQIIREVSGQIPIYPDYINQPKKYFENSVEYTNLFLSVGVGYFSLTNQNIYIAETPSAYYAGDVVVEIFEPGDDVSGNVAYENWYTSPDVSNLQLKSALEEKIGDYSAVFDSSGTIQSYLDGSPVAFPFSVDEIFYVSETTSSLNDQLYRVDSLSTTSATDDTASVTVMEEVEPGIYSELSGGTVNTESIGDVSWESITGGVNWEGPYILCPEGEVTDEFEFDVLFPQGLYRITGGGSQTSTSVSIEVQYRDSSLGGSWSTVSGTSWTANSRDQIGYTINQSLGSSYNPEVRFRRVTGDATDNQTANDVSLLRLKAKLETVTSYDDVTTVALKVRSTRGLANTAENRVSIRGSKRKLPTLTEIRALIDNGTPYDISSDNTGATDLYDISSAEYASSVPTIFNSNYSEEFFFSSDGLRVAIVAEFLLLKQIYTHVLSTAFDISSITSTTAITTHISLDRYANYLQFYDSGYKLLAEADGGETRSFNLSSPNDITTIASATPDETFSDSGFGGVWAQVIDGKLFKMDTTGLIRQYSITGDRIAHFKSLGDYSKQEIDTFIIQLEAYCAENNIHYIPSTK
jgi:hypothetical protein